MSPTSPQTKPAMPMPGCPGLDCTAPACCWIPGPLETTRLLDGGSLRPGRRLRLRDRGLRLCRLSLRLGRLSLRLCRLGLLLFLLIGVLVHFEPSQ